MKNGNEVILKSIVWREAFLSEDWISYFFDIAKMVATRSKDPNTKVGAVIVNKHRSIVSTGYNGFPSNVFDIPERFEHDVKHEYMVHAEANAILLAARHGIKTDGCGCVITKFPCRECMKMIIQSGIKHLYCPPPSERDINYYGAKISLQIMEEAGIETLVYIKAGGLIPIKSHDRDIIRDDVYSTQCNTI